MKTTKRLLALITIATVTFSSVAFAAPDKKKDSSDTKTTTAESTPVAGTSFKATLKGDKVTLSWTLPKDDWRVVTISRNDKVSPKGRAKVTSVNPAKATNYVDTVPEAGKGYWYWLKATRTKGEAVEIGPIQASE